VRRRGRSMRPGPRAAQPSSRQAAPPRRWPPLSSCLSGPTRHNVPCRLPAKRLPSTSSRRCTAAPPPRHPAAAPAARPPPMDCLLWRVPAPHPTHFSRCHRVMASEATLHGLPTNDAARDRPPESLRERILRRVVAEDTEGASRRSVAGSRPGAFAAFSALLTAAFTAVLSRIAVCSFRRESGTCIPPFFRTSAGHRGEGRNPWHLQHARHQLHAGTPCRRLVRSLSLRPSWLLASWADQTERGLSLPQASTSGLPAPKSPCGLPDITTAPNGELRRQDLHLQVQQLVSLRSLQRAQRS
jgi:hypothetical protein